jgi:hypothetical protein
LGCQQSGREVRKTLAHVFDCNELTNPNGRDLANGLFQQPLKDPVLSADVFYASGSGLKVSGWFGVCLEMLGGAPTACHLSSPCSWPDEPARDRGVSPSPAATCIHGPAGGRVRLAGRAARIVAPPASGLRRKRPLASSRHWTLPATHRVRSLKQLLLCTPGARSSRSRYAKPSCPHNGMPGADRRGSGEALTSLAAEKEHRECVRRCRRGWGRRCKRPTPSGGLRDTGPAVASGSPLQPPRSPLD